KLLRVAANEVGRGPQVVERVLVVLNSAQPVINREPVVPGARQRLQELPDERDAAAAVPSAAVNDDHRRTLAPVLLHVSVERQLFAIHAAINYVSHHAGHDVIAFRIANVYRQVFARARPDWRERAGYQEEQNCLRDSSALRNSTVSGEWGMGIVDCGLRIKVETQHVASLP